VGDEVGVGTGSGAGATFIRTASTPRVGQAGSSDSGSRTDSGSGSPVLGETGTGLGRGSGSKESQCGETGPRARAKPTTAMYATPARAAKLAIIHTRRRRRPVVSTKTKRPAGRVDSSNACEVIGIPALLAAQLRPPPTDRTSTTPSFQAQRRRARRTRTAGRPRPVRPQPSPGLRPRDRVSPTVPALAVRQDSEPSDGRAPRAGSDRSTGLTRQLPNVRKRKSGRGGIDVCTPEKINSVIHGLADVRQRGVATDDKPIRY
jgi:hypothetical protein